jgi:hypothetical protein
MMNIPNWQHHSKKEQKPTLKPQALRDRRAALQAFKKKHKNRPDKAVSSYYDTIRYLNI